MSEPAPEKTNPGSSRTSVAVVAGTIALLALLVWFLNPRQPAYKPAPLDPPSSECSKPGREFVPTNITEISDPLLDALSAEEKSRAIFRLNMAPCSCGCNLSIAVCRRNNEECETSKAMLRKTISESGKKTEQAAKQK